MANETSNWELWKKEIDSWQQLEGKAEPVYKKIAGVETTNRLQVIINDYSGFQLMENVGELGEAQDDSPIQGYQNLFPRQVFRKSATFSSDLFETDMHGEIGRIASLFYNIVEYSREVVFSGLFRNAWSGTTYGDGKYAVSTAHPVKGAGYTNANTFADGVQREMTYENLGGLQNVMLSLIDHAGKYMPMGAINVNKILMVPPLLREPAFQYAGVNTSGERPDTADRATNYFRRGDKFDVLVNPYLSYEVARENGEVGTIAKTSSSNYWDTSYFILDEAMTKELCKMYVAQGYPKYDEEVIKSNQALIKYANDKYAPGFISSLCFAASKGDKSTFSS